MGYECVGEWKKKKKRGTHETETIQTQICRDIVPC
jgi:hypothetical protein